jgi:hypothetical protein
LVKSLIIKIALLSVVVHMCNAGTCW